LLSSGKTAKRIFRYVPVLIWTGVILYLSGSGGSSLETSRFIRPLIEFLFPSASAETITSIHFAVRKFAHFAVYFVLGITASRAFGGGDRFRKYWPIYAIAVVIAIASLDEFNQSFEPERTGAAADVLIDLFGGATAVSIYALFARRFRRR
jgi:VanZ family protein